MFFYEPGFSSKPSFIISKIKCGNCTISSPRWPRQGTVHFLSKCSLFVRNRRDVFRWKRIESQADRNEIYRKWMRPFLLIQPQYSLSWADFLIILEIPSPWTTPPFYPLSSFIIKRYSILIKLNFAPLLKRSYNLFFYYIYLHFFEWHLIFCIYDSN